MQPSALPLQALHHRLLLFLSAPATHPPTHAPPPPPPPPCLPPARANPYGEFYLDGVSLNPFEVLFVKVGGGAGAGRVDCKENTCACRGQVLCTCLRRFRGMAPLAGGRARHSSADGGSGRHQRATRTLSLLCPPSIHPSPPPPPPHPTHTHPSPGPPPAPPPPPPPQVKERVLQNDWSFAVQAKKYTEWMEAQVGGGGGRGCTPRGWGGWASCGRERGVLGAG